MTTIMLSLTHQMTNLQKGQAEFKRTWRLNPYTLNREYGYKLLRYWSAETLTGEPLADFGDIKFHFQLPVDQYIRTADYRWEKTDAIYCM